MKKFFISFLAVAVTLLITASCTTMSNTGKGTAIGAGGGAALGALIGTLVSGKSDKGKGAIIGAAIGAGVGGGTGAIIGKQMDKKAAALQAELAQAAAVETVEDSNGLKAIKVTFNNNILFGFNSSTLGADAKISLDKFAASMNQSDLSTTAIVVKGHTDNVGSASANQSVSLKRAQAVGNYLRQRNITSDRLTETGCSYDEPIASNDTEAGRAQNRRVEVFIIATEATVQQYSTAQ